MRLGWCHNNISRRYWKSRIRRVRSYFVSSCSPFTPDPSLSYHDTVPGNWRLGKLQTSFDSFCLCDWWHRYDHTHSDVRAHLLGMFELTAGQSASDTYPPCFRKKHSPELIGSNHLIWNHLSRTSQFLQVETVHVCFYGTIKHSFYSWYKFGWWKIKNLLTAGNRKFVMIGGFWIHLQPAEKGCNVAARGRRIEMYGALCRARSALPLLCSSRVLLHWYLLQLQIHFNQCATSVLRHEAHTGIVLTALNSCARISKTFVWFTFVSL